MCKRLTSEEQFILLDGRSLCTNCHISIKSGKWCANPIFPEPPPKPPTTMEKVKGFFSTLNPEVNYGIRLNEYSHRKEKFIRQKELERESYHEVCDYWPKDQPPDWKYRVRGAKERAGNKCERCGNSFDLHVHHKLSRSQGGNHKPANLVVLCSNCHADESSPGHAIIRKPRSGDLEKEGSLVEELKFMSQVGLLVWKSLKVSKPLICSVCAQEIKKNEVHWECIGGVQGVKKGDVNIRRPRASYNCKNCGKPIMKGDLYIANTFVMVAWRDRMVTEHYCLDCCYHQIVCNYCDAKYAITRRYLNKV